MNGEIEWRLLLGKKRFQASPKSEKARSALKRLGWERVKCETYHNGPAVTVNYVYEHHDRAQAVTHAVVLECDLPTAMTIVEVLRATNKPMARAAERAYDVMTSYCN